MKYLLMIGLVAGCVAWAAAPGAVKPNFIPLDPPSVGFRNETAPIVPSGGEDAFSNGEQAAGVRDR